MAVVAKRSTMTLYSGTLDIYSHQIRIVLAEKGITSEIIYLNPGEKNEDLLDLNPYGTLPTLVDRDLVLYDANIIQEYLDERFPHPPLLPVYPVARAQNRLMRMRVERDWYSLIQKIEDHSTSEDEKQKSRHELLDSILTVAPIFSNTPFFLSDEFSSLDCALAPMFWRFPILGIELPAHAKSIKAYVKRMFERPTFQTSLTDAEREIWVE